VYWGGLLRFLGCTAFSHEEAHRYGAGDDHTLKQVMSDVEWAEKPAAIRRIVTGIGASASPLARAKAVAALLADPAAPAKHAAAACDAGRHLAQRFEMSEGVLRVLDEAFEHWDGAGTPNGIAGDDLSVASRCVHVADAAERSWCHRGVGGAIETVTRQAGRGLEPRRARRSVLA